MMSLSRDQLKIYGGRLLLVLFLLGVWEILTLTVVDPFFVSSPSRIAGYVVKEITDFGFYRDLYVSGVEMGVGFLFGALAGIAAGVLLARWELIAQIVDPFLVALNSIPRMALAPLLIIWFGIDMMSKIVLAGTLVFFVTFFNTIGGVRSVDQRLCNVARVVGASEWQIFLKVMLPSASSWIITGLKMSLPFALIGGVIAIYVVDGTVSRAMRTSPRSSSATPASPASACCRMSVDEKTGCPTDPALSRTSPNASIRSGIEMSGCARPPSSTASPCCGAMHGRRR